MTAGMNPSSEQKFGFWTRADERRVGGVTVGCLILLAYGGWLSDGDRVSLQEIKSRDTPSVPYQLHYQTVTWQELALLPGIGEQLARQLIAERDQAGILTRESLDRIAGIGPAKLEVILQHLTVATPPSDGP